MGNSNTKEADSKKTAKTTTNSQLGKKRKVNFKMHIAIDFGTDGSGIAIAYKNQVHIYNKWRTRTRATTTKTKTHLLLNDTNDLMNFGNNAQFMYAELKKTGQKMKFFERFKMALYADNLENQRNDIKQNDDFDVIDTEKYLNDAAGKPLLSSIVFDVAFKEIKKLAKQHKSRITKEDIKDEEIQWILTVPAIWSESAKDKMRQWMVDAEVVDDDIIDQCVIVFEPDCASLAIQKEYFENIYDNDGSKTAANPCDDMDDLEEKDDMKDNARFEPGDTYILVDAGGGTVDIACHKILDDGAVEEIEPPSGGDWGSSYIDDLFIKLLEDMFSKEWIDFYRNGDNEFVSILMHFEAAKKEFYEDEPGATHTTELPLDFVTFLEEKCDAENIEVENKVQGYSKSIQHFKELFKEKDENDDQGKGKKKKRKKKKKKQASSSGNETTVDIDNEDKCKIKLISDDTDKFKDGKEYLEMDTAIWKCAFDSKLDKMVSHIHELLKKPSLQHNYKYLCLVGGFSSSKYLQERMRTEFGSESQYNLKFIIPRKPILSVVQGAAYFAMEPGYIKARKLKYTYGLIVYLTENDAKKHGISDEYIANNKTDEGMVKDCFNVIARKGDRLGFNQAITEKVCKIPGKSSALITILCSDKDDPKVATAADELGNIEVHFDGDHDEVMVEFQFYGTMFKVYSYPKADPNAREEVVIKYQKRLRV